MSWRILSGNCPILCFPASEKVLFLSGSTFRGDGLTEPIVFHFSFSFGEIFLDVTAKNAHWLAHYEMKHIGWVLTIYVREVLVICRKRSVWSMQVGGGFQVFLDWGRCAVNSLIRDDKQQWHLRHTWSRWQDKACVICCSYLVKCKTGKAMSSSGQWGQFTKGLGVFLCFVWCPCANLASLDFNCGENRRRVSVPAPSDSSLLFICYSSVVNLFWKAQNISDVDVTFLVSMQRHSCVGWLRFSDLFVVAVGFKELPLPTWTCTKVIAFWQRQINNWWQAGSNWKQDCKLWIRATNEKAESCCKLFELCQLQTLVCQMIYSWASLHVRTHADWLQNISLHPVKLTGLTGHRKNFVHFA